MFISQDLIDSLINIGYEIHIFDKDEIYPRGLDREAWQAEEIAKAIAASQQAVEADAGSECERCETLRGKFLKKLRAKLLNIF